MKWIIRNQPGLPVFDTREEAIAEAWAMTAPGKDRPKVDGVMGDEFRFATATAVQLTLTGFVKMGEAAEKAAAEFTGMMRSFQGVVPETIVTTARESTRLDHYSILVRAVRARGPEDESSEPLAASPTSAG